MVKIQRPGIVQKILLDLDLLELVASWAQKNNPDSQVINLEGVAAKLNPKFDIAKEMAPFARELLKRQFDPMRHAKSIFGTLSHYAKFFRNLPSALSEIVYKTKEGKLKIIMNHQGLESMIKNLTR